MHSIVIDFRNFVGKGGKVFRRMNLNLNTTWSSANNIHLLLSKNHQV